jgi:hypothetical protein
MAKLTWRKWFRIIHRDFGYLFFGVTLVYAVSGIAINHLDDWNPELWPHVSEKLMEAEQILHNALKKRDQDQDTLRSTDGL